MNSLTRDSPVCVAPYDFWPEGVEAALGRRCVPVKSVSCGTALTCSYWRRLFRVGISQPILAAKTHAIKTMPWLRH